MNSTEGIKASVYTRWHQLAVPLAFALGVGNFLLVVFNRGPLGLAGLVALIGLLYSLQGFSNPQFDKGHSRQLGVLAPCAGRFF